MGKRVLMLLTNGFRPDPRVAKEAEALSSAGYDVTVLAWDREQKFSSTSEFGKVRIARVRTGWAGSMVSLIMRYPLFFAKALFRGIKMESDVVHAHDFDTLLLGFLLSRLKGVPLVFDAHEHYAQMIADDVPGWVASIVDKIEASLVRKADLVIAVNKAHSAYLVPNAQDRLILVDNCVELPPWKEQAARMDGTVMLFYAGALEPLRYIQETIEAAEKVPGCTFKVAGFGRYEGWVKEKAATGKVVFLGYLPHDKMMDEMASSDAVLCLMDPSNVNNVIGTPNKLFEAMAVGVPLLTLKGTLSGEIVEKEGCGFAFEWSEDAFKRAIGDLKDVDRRKALGLAGRKAAEREYNWGIMKARLLEGYRRILTGQ